VRCHPAKAANFWQTPKPISMILTLKLGWYIKLPLYHWWDYQKRSQTVGNHLVDKNYSISFPLERTESTIKQKPISEKLRTINQVPFCQKYYETFGKIQMETCNVTENDSNINTLYLLAQNKEHYGVRES
jgi:hypothetical protein